MADLFALTSTTVAGAYKGSATRCACGCSGKWRYRNEPGLSDPAFMAEVLGKVQRAAAAGKKVDHYTYGDGSERWAFNNGRNLLMVDSAPTDPTYYERQRAALVAEQQAAQAAASMGEGI